MPDQRDSRQRATGRTPKRQTRHSNTLVEHTIVDLDETYKPQDLIDALSDMRFRRGPKLLRIDRDVRDYLLSALAALTGHDRRIQRR
jgi:hypothetical protein